MNENRFEGLISSVWAFLHSYYLRQESLNPLEFVLTSNTSAARMLVDDSSDDDSAYVALEFPFSVKASVIATEQLPLQEFSVICEEVSHFFHYTESASIDQPISVFELETRAEIDRFLCFMHWNDFYPNLSLITGHENCREICDSLFEKRIFHTDNLQLYQDAESLAYYHLKRAFSHCWTKRWVDTSRFDPIARRYLLQRLSITEKTLLSA